MLYSTPVYNNPCYIAVFECYITHCHSTCYIAPTVTATQLFSTPIKTADRAEK